MTRAFQFLLLTLIASTNSYSQKAGEYDWYLAESNGGLCNQSLVFFKDSTYCSERGCEGSSHFSFGKWTQKKNLLKLTPADPTRFNFIARVVTKKTNENKLIVIIFDKDGINITSRIAVRQSIKGKGAFTVDLDSTNSKRTDFIRNNSTIRLTTLERLFKQPFEITRDSANYFEIYLTIPREWNFHKSSEWDNSGTFSLTKSNDKLFTTMPDHFDDKGKLIPTEYIRQNE